MGGPVRRVASSTAADAARVLVNCTPVETSRISYIHADPKDVEWAIQNANLVWQFAALKTGEQTRDQSMAENGAWIAGQSPRRKVIVWAHTGHGAYTGCAGLDPRSGYLRETFGTVFINFLFAFVM